MLAAASESDESPPIAAQPSTTSPYRPLVRRRFSEPLLLLLIFVFGVWLWDLHFGSEAPPEDPELAWEFALRKADRDLRLSVGTAHLPAWSRPLLGIDPLDQTLDRTTASLRQLQLLLSLAPHDHADHGGQTEAHPFANEGAYALGVLTALNQGGDPAVGPFQQYGLAAPPKPGSMVSRIIQGQEYWWDLEYLRALHVPEAEVAAQGVEARTRHLTGNVVKARGAVFALALGGLVFLPGTLAAFARAGRPTPGPVNYTHRWSLNFGLGVFLLATLAFIGFSRTFNLAIENLIQGAGGEPLSMPLFITLDSLTRFLPVFIALAFLFRRGRHAVSRLGLAGPLDGRMVLGAFAILQIVDFGLRMTLDRSAPPDPTGGLSPGESGPWGLLFGVVSACLAAPVAEEIVFRGVLFRSLANRLRLPVAVGVSSLIFALVHPYGLPSLLAVAVVGILCALSYVSSRSLLTAVALHALYNAAIKIPEWILYHAPLS